MGEEAQGTKRRLIAEKDKLRKGEHPNKKGKEERLSYPQARRRTREKTLARVAFSGGKTGTRCG